MPRDLHALRDALAAHLACGADITGVRQMAHGLSNATYVLEGAGRVLRMPPDEEGILPPYELDRQYAIYQRVAGAPGAPLVPAVSDYCGDENVAGAPFYLMEQLAGQTFDRHALPRWLTSNPPMCAAFCREWVDTLAKVHMLPLATLDGLSPRRTVEQEAVHWLAEAESVSAPELVRELLKSFVVTPPPSTGADACVHGDPNLTNILWDGPRAVALLDWELSTIGEPFADIAFLLAFFRDDGEPVGWGLDERGWWTKPQVVRHWESVTGRRVANWRDHELLAMCRLATILCKSERLVSAGKKTDPRFADMSRKLGPYLERIERRLGHRHDPD